jgi:excisionase family DNA binding protein
MNSERWVSLDAIAEHLAVSRDTVYRRIKKRGMPAHRVGRQWKFKISQVDAWVEGGEAGEDIAVDKRDI